VSDAVKRDVHAKHEVRFGQWWGRYVVGLTDDEVAAGAASRAAMRAAEAAWMASALIVMRRSE